jgi:hypothetical protein
MGHSLLRRDSLGEHIGSAAFGLPLARLTNRFGISFGFAAQTLIAAG